MVVEIEYYKGDVLLYGNNISKHDLKKQLIDTGLLLGCKGEK